jgi:perosamine synthetase
MPTVVFAAETGVTREGLQAGFASENIDARVFFWPVSSFPIFEAARRNTKAWSIPSRAINLPSYHDISADEINRVCHVIRHHFGGCHG